MILFTLKISYTLIILFGHTLNLDLFIYLISFLASSEISHRYPSQFHVLFYHFYNLSSLIPYTFIIFIIYLFILGYMNSYRLHANSHVHKGNKPINAYICLCLKSNTYTFRHIYICVYICPHTNIYTYIYIPSSKGPVSLALIFSHRLPLCP